MESSKWGKNVAMFCLDPYHDNVMLWSLLSTIAPLPRPDLRYKQQYSISIETLQCVRDCSEQGTEKSVRFNTGSNRSLQQVSDPCLPRCY